MISVRFQGKPFNITIIQVYAPTSNTEEAHVEQFYEDLQDLLELTPKKDVLFINKKNSILERTMEKAMAPDSSTLDWKIPWTEEPGALQSMGSLEVRHD